jgi:hypothetical protein
MDVIEDGGEDRYGDGGASTALLIVEGLVSESLLSRGGVRLPPGYIEII